MKAVARASISMLLATSLTVAAPANAAADQSVGAPFELSGPMMQGGYAIGRLPAGDMQLDFAGQPVRVAPDGRFIIGFGREAPSTGWLEARTRDGKLLRQPVAIGRRTFASENIPGLRKFVSPPKPTAEALARRRVEIANIRAARFGVSPSLNWTESFRWPVLGRVSAEFGSQRIVDGKLISTHYGVDVAAPAGTLITAPAGGRVKLAAPDYSLEGGIVIVDHGHGLSSTFLHLSRLDVRTGAQLKRGDPIGAVGSTGRSTGPHLHWAMHWGRTRIDPALFVEPMAVTLASTSSSPQAAEHGAGTASMVSGGFK